jgi:hypothetical protein
MNWLEVQASNVAAIAYDADIYTLAIRYRDGSVYICPNVSATTFGSLATSNSKGKILAEMVGHWVRITEGGAPAKSRERERARKGLGLPMSRISYSDDEAYPGQFDLWHANCRRSLQGKEGQAELRELRAALLALPEKRLVRGVLVDGEGCVCAVGAYAKYKGLDLHTFDPEDHSDEVGIVAGMPKLVAWKVVEMNDFDFDHLTPERRYVKMLDWVESQITGALPPVGGVTHVKLVGEEVTLLG